jgi:toxin ParE1/3/4
MQLEITDEADRDVDRLHEYGSTVYGERQADSYLIELLGEYRRIVAWPLAARERHDVRPPIRLRRFRAHNIFYDVTADAVTIVRILHHTADWVNIL